MAQIEYPPSCLYVLTLDGDDVIEAPSDDRQAMLNFMVRVAEMSATLAEGQELTIARFQQ